MKVYLILLTILLLTGCGSKESEDPLPAISDEHEDNADAIDVVADIPILEKNVTLLKEQIRHAESDVLKYRRIDGARGGRRLPSEEHYHKWMEAKAQYGNELLLLEEKHPFLADSNTVATVLDSDSLRKHHAQLKLNIKTVEDVEYSWLVKRVRLQSQRSVLKQLQDRVKELEKTHKEVSDRLSVLRVKAKLKSGEDIQEKH